MKTTTNTENEPTITWVLKTKFKDLTDEEIIEVIDSVTKQSHGNWNIVDICKAILRKAQEK